MKIEKWYNDIYTCNRCGYCRQMVDLETGTYKVCPIREKLGFESYNARGRIKIARAILEGKFNYNSELVDRLYTCLLCGNCKVHCDPHSINIMAITRAMREDAVNMGLAPPEPLRQVDLNVRERHNVFGEDASKQTNWTKGLNIPKKGKTVYFAGCYASYRQPQTARTTIAVLESAGIKAAYLGEDEWCCGIPQFADGSASTAEEVARHNVEAIEAAGAERVIASCSGCYGALKSEYPEIVGKLPFKVLHVSQIFTDLLNKGKLKLNKSVYKNVTYHDPCHLGRYEGIYEPPRDVIKSVEGITLAEMLRNRDNAWCCGGGMGSVYVAYHDLATEIAEDRVKEAMDTKAEAIVTSCPLCVQNLTLAARKGKIEVVDLPVFVAKALGLKI